MADSKPTLYGLVGPGTRAVRNLWMLEELGIEYNHDNEASPHSEKLKQVNPLGKIPALVDGQLCMYESAAINTYLGDKYGGESGLVPKPGTIERGKYEQINMTIMTELESQGVWLHRKYSEFKSNPEVVADAKDLTLKTVKALCSEIVNSGGPYLLGATFSAVDINFVYCINWAKRCGWDADWAAAHPALAPYASSCKARAAYQRMMQLPVCSKYREWAPP